MALRCNGFQFASSGVWVAGATASLSAIPSALHGNRWQTGRIRNLTAGQGITSELVGIPSGYRNGAAWMMPQKAGALASRNIAGLTITPTGTVYGGITADATSAMTFTVADAAGELISSGEGAASLAIAIADALLTASLSGDGEASLTITTNTPLLGAEASVEATATFTITGTLTPYAIGNMEGTTDIATDIVNANIVSVNGYAVTGNGQVGTEWGPA